jgi:hypothetical protein
VGHVSAHRLAEQVRARRSNRMVERYVKNLGIAGQLGHGAQRRLNKLALITLNLRRCSPPRFAIFCK